MKIIIIMAAVLLAALATVWRAQKTEFGVKGGVNFATFTVNENAQDILGEAGSMTCFQLGLTLDIPFTSKMYTSDVYLMTGLEISQKGFKSSSNIAGIAKSTQSANPLYLQLPLYFAYKIPIAEGMKFVPRVGPYLAYGLSGKWTASANVLGLDIEDPEGVDLYGDQGMLKNFDYGLGVGFGVEYSQFGLYLGYELGLANLAGDNMKKVLSLTGEDFSLKTGNLYINLGYRF